MDVIAGKMQQKGYMCKLLQTDYAFHSAQMDPILDEIEKFGGASDFRATRETVNFFPALEVAKLSTVEQDTVWVEIGPHPVNVGFVKSAFGYSCVTVPSLRRSEKSWTTVGQSAATLHTAGVPISWSDFHRPFESRLRLLDLPTYAWSDKTYWIQYNGDWSLTKGNTFYDEEKHTSKVLASPVVDARLSTTAVQQIIQADFNGPYGKVVMQSELMQSDFLAAAHGHSMNGCGVVTPSIHSDIAYTLGRYLHKRLRPNEKEINMDVQDLLVEKGLVANQDVNSTKLIRVSATTKDISTGIVELEWSNVHPNGDVEDRFASAILRYGSASDWLASWAPLSHLIESRIDTLEKLVETGAANRFSRSMAYTLFAKNLVNYADKYRGMQSVVLSGFEGFADVTLTTKDEGGTWTVPPHFIDSVAHLAGFIMNVTDAHDVDKNFCVTPGWKSMAFARPLTAGESYRSYVKMIPTEQDKSVYMGDVYILQDHIIVGKVGGITFRRYPRILLDRFFSPPDKAVAKSNTAPTTTTLPSAKPESMTTKPALTPTSQPKETAKEAEKQAIKTPPPPPETAKQSATEATGTTGRAMALIAAETGMDPGELKDSASFADLGIDSLMSLVIAEKFRSELGLDVRGSLFLDYPSVESLKGWLDDARDPDNRHSPKQGSGLPRPCTCDLEPHPFGTKRMESFLYVTPSQQTPSPNNIEIHRHYSPTAKSSHSSNMQTPSLDIFSGRTVGTLAVTSGAFLSGKSPLLLLRNPPKFRTNIPQA
ncbi:hypothetical protein B9Z65_1391 [Elsinoe australis]|uniref:Uncharacterized protein n=1 Tax=Elsinoe australis TaxID=40998 RepID=A0A2P7YFR5_9PEZI|nr:hypothetical protein B9Z65_1391 [Elsinoe australis]